MELDLSDLKSVQQCASKFEGDLDYLVLNAGIGPSSAISKNGLGAVFQTNYLGHWLLTHMLLDTLKQTARKRGDSAELGAPVRIVAVSSGGHAGKDIPCDDDQAWDEFIRGGCGYGQSKLLQIMHLRLNSIPTLQIK